MNIYKKLLNNTLVFAAGNLLSKLVIFFLLPIYTYYLSPAEYGLVDLSVITISLIIPFFTLSIVESILRYVMDKDYDNQAVLINSAVVVAGGYFIALIFYPVFVLVFPFDEYIEYFYFLLLFQVGNVFLTQYVRAKGMIKLFVFTGVFTSILLLLWNIVFLVILELSVEGYFLSSIFAYLFSSFLLILKGKLLKDINIKKIDFTLLKEMLGFSIPLIPNTIMWWIMGVSDRYMLTYFLGLGSVGLYAVAVKIPTLLNAVNTVFFQAWQMSAIEEAKEEKKSLFYTNVFNSFSVVMFVTTSLLIVFLKPIMSVIVSDDFFEAWKYIPFLFLSIVFSSFSGFLGINYIVAKDTKGVFKTSVIGAVINVLINLMLIPTIGIYGAALGTMFSFLIVWLLRIKDTKKFVDIKLNITKVCLTILMLSFQISILYLEFEKEYLVETFFFLLIIIINLREIKLIVNKIFTIILKRI